MPRRRIIGGTATSVCAASISRASTSRSTEFRSTIRKTRCCTSPTFQISQAACDRCRCSAASGRAATERPPTPARSTWRRFRSPRSPRGGDGAARGRLVRIAARQRRVRERASAEPFRDVRRVSGAADERLSLSLGRRRALAVSVGRLFRRSRHRQSSPLTTGTMRDTMAYLAVAECGPRYESAHQSADAARARRIRRTAGRARVYAAA